MDSYVITDHGPLANNHEYYYVCIYVLISGPTVLTSADVLREEFYMYYVLACGMTCKLTSKHGFIRCDILDTQTDYQKRKVC